MLRKSIYIAVTALLIYDSLLSGQFIWDDHFMIVKKVPEHMDNLLNAFHYLQPFEWLKINSYMRWDYRPVLDFSFALDYSIWKLNPFGYHLTNNILFVINLILLFKFLSIIMGNAKKAFPAVLLFALYPLNVETVAWIKNRSNMICFIFMLIAFITYINLLKKSSAPGYEKKTRGCSHNSLLYFFISRFSLWALGIAAYIFSFAAKATAISLPPLIVLYALIFPEKHFRKKALILSLPFWIVAIGLFFLWSELISQKVFNHASWEGDLLPGAHIALILNTLIFYLRKIIFPFRLCALYPLPPEYFVIDSGTFITLIFLFLSCLAFLFALKKNFKLTAFSIGWLALSIFPISNVKFFEIRPLADQRLFMPSAGYVMLLATAYDKLRQRSRSHLKISYARYLPDIIFLSLIVLFAWQTHQRSQVWITPYVFWKNTAECSDTYLAHNNLGLEYEEIGEWEKAKREYEAAIEMEPASYLGHYNLARYYQFKGITGEAIRKYQDAVDCDRYLFDERQLLGTLYYQEGLYSKAAEVFSEILAAEPPPETKQQAHYNLATALEVLGKLDKARRHYKLCLSINPSHESAAHNLALLEENFE